MDNKKFYKSLKWIRVGVAIVVISLITLSFTLLGKQLVHVSQFLHIQFIPSLLTFTGGSLVAFIFFILLTLLFGRTYCSFMCPLGIFQDVISRISNLFKNKKQKKQRYSKPQNILRYSILIVVFTTLLVGIFFPLLLLDPYSNYGRIAQHVFNPIIQVVSNGLSYIFPNAIYYRAYGSIGVGAFIFALSFMLIVTMMSAFRGRLYCNTICPVGSLLGVISKISIFKLSIDKTACVGCANCVNHCKSECIDMKTREIDESRCVACFDCATVCSQGGIRYVPRWKAHPKSAPITPEERTKELNGRRGAITALGSLGVLLLTMNIKDKRVDKGQKGDFMPSVKKIKGIVPPGGRGIEFLLDNCTACHACIAACPSNIITFATDEYGTRGLLLPTIHYDNKFCAYDCMRCSEVCPNNALVKMPLSRKQLTRIGVSHYTLENCVVYKMGTDCGACDEHCPTKAITMVPYKDGRFIPSINVEYCIGCGGCEYICPATPKAITVTPLLRHSIAKRPLVEAQEEKTITDFGF